MRFYGWDRGDVQRCVERTYFDAEQGRVALALERLVDIEAALPNEGALLYTEGVLRSAFLGQGLLARACFERAYTAWGQDQSDSPNRWIAANEIVRFARDAEDLRSWVPIAQREAPNESERETVGAPLEVLAQGETYQTILQVSSQLNAEHERFGLAAALLELTLELGGLPPDREVELRRHRAQQLRNLDQQAHGYRENIGEMFPPDERLALHGALAELERALVLDPYDPELWNLKSAWCVLLGQHQTALECADQALELRPHNYPKPLVNRSLALWEMGRDSEALTAAQDALAQAQESKSAIDIQQAQERTLGYSRGRSVPSLDRLLPLTELIIRHAETEQTYADRTLNIRVSQVVERVLRQAGEIPSHAVDVFARVIAELLADFTPETVFLVIVRLRRLVPVVADRCVTALLYIVAHAGAVERRDAARCLIITILRPRSSTDIRSLYRRLVLAPSAAGDAGLTQLDAIIREELRRIHTSFPELIADQEPITDEERKQAARAVLSGAINSATVGDRRTQGGPRLVRAVLIIALIIVLSALLVRQIDLLHLINGAREETMALGIYIAACVVIGISCTPLLRPANRPSSGISIRRTWDAEDSDYGWVGRLDRKEETLTQKMRRGNLGLAIVLIVLFLSCGATVALLASNSSSAWMLAVLLALPNGYGLALARYNIAKVRTHRSR